MIRTVIYLVLSVLCLTPGSVTIANGQVQVTDIKVLERGNDWQCPSMEERERTKNEIHQIAASVIATLTGHTHTCNGTPGWRRVAFINMTDTSYNCPTGLSLPSYSKRTCGSLLRSEYGGCSSTTFRNDDGMPYSQVCGRLRGYQFGATGAFHTSDQGIDSYYINGVSLTHGGAGNRQHIWTFASGISEIPPNIGEGCPCDTSRYDSVPVFVGNDYFCESGVNSIWTGNRVFYPDDVLWDGQDCTANSTCCQLNNPPWFTKNLTTATIDDIELRICSNTNPSIEDTPLELIELYVQ